MENFTLKLRCYTSRGIRMTCAYAYVTLKTAVTLLLTYLFFKIDIYKQEVIAVTKGVTAALQRANQCNRANFWKIWGWA